MPDLQNFDIVICGGGCSAMLLLYYLEQYPEFSKLKVLVIEKEPINDKKTWCFWHKGTYPLQHLISSSWNRIRFADQHFSTTQTIQPYIYSSIKGEDFYDYFLNQFIPKLSNIKIIIDEVSRIEKQIGISSKVICKGGTYTSAAVYSSIIEEHFYGAPIFMWQHFKGWHIKTETNIFDNDTMTLMDFSNCLPNTCNFVYVLPYSKNEALIEVTAFSTKVWDDTEYLEQFNKHTSQLLEGIDFEILGIEQGKIPMVDYQHSLFGSGGQILIGTAAGKLKPTSGYGFEKMRVDAENLASTYYLRNTPQQKIIHRFKFYDKLLLKIISENPKQAVKIFGQLFKKTPIPIILKFLYEETNLYEEALIFCKLPFLPFIKRI